MIRGTSLEPQVYVSFTSNWVELSLTYITDVKAGIALRSETSSRILKHLAENGIAVSSESLNVSIEGRPGQG